MTRRTLANQCIEFFVNELQGTGGYIDLFEKTYPGQGIDGVTIGKALVFVDRMIISAFKAPLDRWLAGNEKAVSRSAKINFKLFDGKTHLSLCRSGSNFPMEFFII